MVDIRIVEERHEQPTLFGELLVSTVYRIADWDTYVPLNEIRYETIGEAERAIRTLLISSRRMKEETIKLTPEEEFEQAIQQYITACAEWKLAITRYIRDVGQAQAMPKLEEAHNRVVRTDAVMMSEEEIRLRASRAKTIVDAEKKKE